MKSQIIFCVLLSLCPFVYSQTGKAIYSASDSGIITKSEFIDTFFIENTSSLTPYVLKKTEPLISSSVYGSFSLELLKFNGYESEPGICNVVRIKKDGNQVFNINSSNGFASISSYVSSESGEYSLVQLDKNIYVLIFNEWIYASQPSMTSIILIRNGQTKLVYNKPMFINSINKSIGNLQITLQANTVESLNDNLIPIKTPETHTVIWDGSALRYQ